MTQRQFHRLALYQEFYRWMRVEYQISFTLPAPSPVLISLALNRSHRDFSERDRLLLNLLRSHLIRAHQNAMVLTQVQQLLAQLEATVEVTAGGVILLTGRGEVQMMTASALRWMAEYFELPRLASSLPEALGRWLRHLLGQLNGDKPSAPLAPLVIERNWKRLVVRLVLQPSGNPCLLLAEQEPASPRVLERLGLSRRRAEVLFWVAQGKTDEEVAGILGCTVGTAKKHLQRIFEQLGVGNRHAATLRALDILGLPDKTDF